ncbi:MAG TPA: sigma-70 family RNA polymerase sigma factor [Anaerolineales bacterium]|jgi:RNA polymerase sigma-70 factor (ECF subfamily)|nr:sigma-70 family RNA polymerase sigma factor [Anaerolineales bacterium]
MPPLTDDEALSSATQGDKTAFGRLYDKYAARIYNYVYYRTGSTQDAEDITSRVFFRAMRHITNYTDRGVPFSAWLYRIAHNLVANWHRDSSRHQEVELEDGYRASKSEEHPEVALLESEEQQALMRLIRNLPEERQQLLILKFVEHMSNAEIGEIMDRTEGAIKSLYHRTLLSLREEITKDTTGSFSLDMFGELPSEE